jgi:AbrB family looped-hinge helix DNA binding protein
MSADGVLEIPKAIRDQVGIEAGDELIVEVDGSGLVVRKAVSTFDYKPPRPRRELGLTDREIADIAWEDHVTEKFGQPHGPESARAGEPEAADDGSAAS